MEWGIYFRKRFRQPDGWRNGGADFRGSICSALSSTTPAYGHPFYIEGELPAARGG